MKKLKQGAQKGNTNALKKGRDKPLSIRATTEVLELIDDQDGNRSDVIERLVLKNLK